jgi:hypothetical protein
MYFAGYLPSMAAPPPATPNSMKNRQSAPGDIAPFCARACAIGLVISSASSASAVLAPAKSRLIEKLCF